MKSLPCEKLNMKGKLAVRNKLRECCSKGSNQNRSQHFCLYCLSNVFLYLLVLMNSTPENMNKEIGMY